MNGSEDGGGRGGRDGPSATAPRVALRSVITGVTTITTSMATVKPAGKVADDDESLWIRLCLARSASSPPGWDWVLSKASAKDLDIESVLRRIQGCSSRSDARTLAPALSRCLRECLGAFETSAVSLPLITALVQGVFGTSISPPLSAAEALYLLTGGGEHGGTSEAEATIGEVLRRGEALMRDESRRMELVEEVLKLFQELFCGLGTSADAGAMLRPFFWHKQDTCCKTLATYTAFSSAKGTSAMDPVRANATLAFVMLLYQSASNLCTDGLGVELRYSLWVQAIALLTRHGSKSVLVMPRSRDSTGMPRTYPASVGEWVGWLSPAKAASRSRQAVSDTPRRTLHPLGTAGVLLTYKLLRTSEDIWGLSDKFEEKVGIDKEDIKSLAIYGWAGVPLLTSRIAADPVRLGADASVLSLLQLRCLTSLPRGLKLLFHCGAYVDNCDPLVLEVLASCTRVLALQLREGIPSPDTACVACEILHRCFVYQQKNAIALGGVNWDAGKLSVKKRLERLDIELTQPVDLGSFSWEELWSVLFGLVIKMAKPVKKGSAAKGRYHHPLAQSAVQLINFGIGYGDVIMARESDYDTLVYNVVYNQDSVRALGRVAAARNGISADSLPAVVATISRSSRYSAEEQNVMSIDKGTNSPPAHRRSKSASGVRRSQGTSLRLENIKAVGEHFTGFFDGTDSESVFSAIRVGFKTLRLIILGDCFPYDHVEMIAVPRLEGTCVGALLRSLQCSWKNPT